MGRLGPIPYHFQRRIRRNQVGVVTQFDQRRQAGCADVCECALQRRRKECRRIDRERENRTLVAPMPSDDFAAMPAGTP